MVGVIIWALAVIAIFLLLKGYYDYKYFIACYDGLIFSVKWIGQFLVGRWEWLRSLRALKQAYVIIAGFVGVALLFLFARLYLEVASIKWDNIGEDDGKIRNLAIAFVGTITGIGALFVVFLTILRSEENTRQNIIANDQKEIADKQAKTAEQGLITDRINKAVESLGKLNRADKPVLEVRIGALYALERIAQDSLEDHIRIMKIICAYIYVIASLTNSTDMVSGVEEDIRTALIIIGQRGEWTENQKHLKEEEKQNYQLDLRNCNLRNADLNNANMSRARLSITTFERARLNGAILRNANLIKTNLTKAQLNKTDFKNAYMGGAWAYEGDFLRCLNLTQRQLDDMYCGSEIKVKIPNNLTRPAHWPTQNLTRDDFIKAYKEWLKTQE